MIIIVLMGSLFTAFVTAYTVWPFFSYSLYAYPEKNQKSYQSVEIILDGKPFYFYKVMPVAIAATLENEANSYIFLKENNFTDKFYYKLIEKRNLTLPPFFDRIFKYDNLNDKIFAKWMKDFIEINSDGLPVQSIRLNKIFISYGKKIEIIDRKLVFEKHF